MAISASTPSAPPPMSVRTPAAVWLPGTLAPASPVVSTRTYETRRQLLVRSTLDDALAATPSGQPYLGGASLRTPGAEDRHRQGTDDRPQDDGHKAKLEPEAKQHGQRAGEYAGQLHIGREPDGEHAVDTAIPVVFRYRGHSLAFQSQIAAAGGPHALEDAQLVGRLGHCGTSSLR